MTRKLICVFLALALCAGLAVSVSAVDNAGFVYDEANLLGDADEVALIRKLATVSDAYDAQVVVYTMRSTGGYSIDSYVDFVYDSLGFGYGPQRDGVLLLIVMDIREYRIISNGYAAAAITNSDIDRICDVIVDDLSAGDYAGAFQGFADECGYYLNGYINGFPFDVTGNLGISLVIGLVVGLIVVLVMQNQLTSVRKQHAANVYVKDGSMHLTSSRDMFLYRNVTRSKRASSNNSSSSSHSGGSSRSRGGGSF